MKRILIVLTIACAPFLASAQEPPAPMIVAGFLGFTDAQGARFGQLLEGLQSTVGPLQQQIMVQQKELDTVLSADQPDPAAVGKLVLTIRALQKQVGQAFQAYHDGFLAMLTQEQKEKTQAVIGAAQLLPAVRAFAEVHLIDPPQ
jgi:Spy/CpxP family protein refolding chaperone